MRVAIAAALVFTTSAVVFACSEDSGASTDSEADGGSADAGGTEEDAGGERAPTGCLLKSTTLKTGAKAENVARPGVQNAADWTNPSEALSTDGKFATVTLAEGQESATLRISDFRLQVPAGAETWGIQVELTRRAPDGGVEDGRIDIEIENKTTRAKLVDGPWPMSAVGTHEYGQAVDTWGADVEPKDFNTPSFAAKLTVKRAANAVGPVTAIVDSMRAAVTFCPEPAKK